ncbi:hypothetical protein HELRODRAFT_161568 [Helobdella robusta]|uniref:Peptidase M16 middle/third domain-containing protein n=1 Tax=Helobdella robusta TaxID=6412 RepID=T1ERM5_HELRO|nr:hypothetical protein HELRODRAFT_161568 [Helobdella robusta]ESO02313.1 hypothetical protein HELRODRAFT_161568 [Helobdella robusta]
MIKSDYQEYVDMLCSCMLDVEPRDYVVSNFLSLEFDDQLIQDCLDLLKPDRMNVVIRSQTFKSCCRLEETWFKSMYSVEDPPDNPELRLPSKNPFIATDFTLKPVETDYLTIKELALGSELIRIWFQSDNEFNTPKVVNDDDNTSLYRRSCLSDLFVFYVRESLRESAHQAGVAHLKNYIGVADYGFYLKFSGFNHKLKNLYQLYIDGIRSLKTNSETFRMVKERTRNLYKNQILCPEQLCSQLQASYLLSKLSTVTQKLDCVDCVSEEMLASYVESIFDGVFVEALFKGNVTSKHMQDAVNPIPVIRTMTIYCYTISPSSNNEALNLSEYFVDKLMFQPLTNCSAIYVTEIQRGRTLLAVPNKNDDDNNCVIANYYQLPEPGCLKDLLLAEMFVSLMEQPCFDELRTNQQLGYSATPSLVIVYGVVGFSITVCSQSDKFSMKQLDDCIEDFVDSFYYKIVDGADEGFTDMLTSMINSRNGVDVSLSGQVLRFWNEILTREYEFNRNNEELNVLHELTADDLRDFCQSIIPRDRTSRRKLSIQVIGKRQLRT